MAANTFRKYPKAVLQASLPEEIIEEVGLRAIRERKPENAMLAELLCSSLGLDPAKFGIDAAPSHVSAN